MNSTHCVQCGHELTITRHDGRSRDYCPECERIQYQNPKPCAGVLVIDEDEILLIKRTEPPEVGSWSIPAGYLETDEPPAEGAVRELREETSLQTTTDCISLHDTVFTKHPDGWPVLVLVYTAPRSLTQGNPQAGSDAASAQFWNVEELVSETSETIESGYTDVFYSASEEGVAR